MVVLRLRGRTTLGATAFLVLAVLRRAPRDVGGRLYLSGVAPELIERLHRTGSIEGPVRAFEATSVVGESTPGGLP